MTTPIMLVDRAPSAPSTAAAPSQMPFESTTLEQEQLTSVMLPQSSFERTHHPDPVVPVTPEPRAITVLPPTPSSLRPDIGPLEKISKLRHKNPLDLRDERLIGVYGFLRGRGDRSHLVFHPLLKCDYCQRDDEELGEKRCHFGTLLFCPYGPERGGDWRHGSVYTGGDCDKVKKLVKADPKNIDIRLNGATRVDPKTVYCNGDDISFKFRLNLPIIRQLEEFELNGGTGPMGEYVEKQVGDSNNKNHGTGNGHSESTSRPKRKRKSKGWTKIKVRSQKRARSASTDPIWPLADPSETASDDSDNEPDDNADIPEDIDDQALLYDDDRGGGIGHEVDLVGESSTPQPATLHTPARTVSPRRTKHSKRPKTRPESTGNTSREIDDAIAILERQKETNAKREELIRVQAAALEQNADALKQAETTAVSLEKQKEENVRLRREMAELQDAFDKAQREHEHLIKRKNAKVTRLERQIPYLEARLKEAEAERDVGETS